MASARTTVCAVEELPAGARRLTEVGGRSVGVFNVDGDLYALLNRCPHRGAPLCAGHHGGTMLPSDPAEYEYGLDGCVIACPWHAREFDIRTGRSLLPGDETRVRTYAVSVEDGQVVVGPAEAPR